MISTAVVGHESRIVQAAELARSLDAILTLDDGSGPEANHLRAWHATTARDADWALVLEDDAVPVCGFHEQAEAALAASPEPVVSFYLGRGMPPRWQPRIHDALQLADRDGAHWITTSHVLHAVAVAIRTELRADWLEWAPQSKLHADERLTEWCKKRGHRVAYPVPSLVDHADGPTIMNHRDRQPRTTPRIAWRTGTRDHWNSKTAAM